MGAGRGPDSRVQSGRATPLEFGPPLPVSSPIMLTALLCTSLLAAAAPERVSAGVGALPLTREAFVALPRPPGEKVTVERKRAVKDAKCHDVACMAFTLPFVLAELATAPEFDEALVSVDRELLDRARFGLDGRLRSYVGRDPRGGAIAVRRLPLPRLGFDAVLVSARAPAVDGPWRGVPLVPQLGLLEAYRAAIGRATGEARTALVVEATGALEAEAQPLVSERLETGSDDERGALVRALCGSEHLSPEQLAAVPSPGPRFALAGLECGKGPDDALKRRLRPALVAGVCRGELGESAPVSEALSDPSTRAEVGLALDRCGPSPRRTWMRTCLQLPVATSDYAALFSDAALAERVRGCVDPDRPLQRGAYLAGLRAEPKQRFWIEGLARSRLDPTADELTAIAEAYVSPELGKGRVAWRAQALRRFSRAPADLTLGARQVLARALASLPPVSAALPARGRVAQVWDALAGEDRDERPSLEIARVLLGERARGLAAARGIGPGSGPEDASLLARQSGLVWFGLSLSGCSEAQIRAAVGPARAATADPSGEVCPAK